MKALLLLLLALLACVFGDTFYDDLGVGADADEATIKKVRMRAGPFCLCACLQRLFSLAL